MSLTQAQGLLLSDDILMKHFVEDGPKVIQLSHRLPFFEVDGDTERWGTTAALPSATPQAFGGPYIEQTTIPVTRTYSFGYIGTSRTVNHATQDLQSNVNDQAAVQLEMGVRNLLYEFWRQFILGITATPGEFQGLDNIINQPGFAGQIINAAGVALTTSQLDRALRLIGQGDGFADVIYTSTKGYNAIREAFFARGGVPQHKEFEVPDGNGGTKLMSVTHVDGVPVLWSDFVPLETGDTRTKVWILKLGQDHVHGIVPASTGKHSMIKIRSTVQPGVSVAEYQLNFPVGISVPSVKDIAMIKDIAV